MLQPLMVTLWMLFGLIAYWSDSRPEAMLFCGLVAVASAILYQGK